MSQFIANNNTSGECAAHRGIQYYRPEIYRFIEEQYVDRFLESGELRLTSLRKLREGENARTDRDEGLFEQKFVNEKSSICPVLHSDPHENVYVLCASLSPYAYNPQRYKYCLKITNVKKFADAITDALEESGYDVVSVMAGPCNYSGRAECISVPRDSQDEQEFSRHIGKVLKISNGDALFQKPSVFMKEHEYRIAWWIKKATEKDSEQYIYLKGIKESRSCSEKVNAGKRAFYDCGVGRYVFYFLWCMLKCIHEFCARIARSISSLVYAIRRLK